MATPPGLQRRRENGWPPPAGRIAEPMTHDGGPPAAEGGSGRQLTAEEDLRAVTVGELRPLDGRIELTPYLPEWPALYAREEARIRSALGGAVVRLEHVGSTSVPGLAAKPVIDILLVVPDSSDEPAYVPDLEAAGYVLRIREPGWFEHRMFRGPDTSVNLHVFSPGAAEVDRMLVFRDWLRSDDADRHLYELAKLDLAAARLEVRPALCRREDGGRDGDPGAGARGRRGSATTGRTTCPTGREEASIVTYSIVARDAQDR